MSSIRVGYTKALKDVRWPFDPPKKKVLVDHGQRTDPHGRSMSFVEEVDDDHAAHVRLHAEMEEP